MRFMAALADVDQTVLRMWTQWRRRRTGNSAAAPAPFVRAGSCVAESLTPIAVAAPAALKLRVVA
jgi:hypothetical protein